jgi:hypothetical protein
MKKLIKYFAVMFLCAAALFAQKADYSKDPGYLDLSSLSAFTSGDKGQEIIVEQGLFTMLAKMAKENNDALAQQLSQLKLVRLNSFDVEDSNEKAVEEKMISIDKDLLNKNWDRIVRTKSNNEYTNIYVKTSGTDKFLGIVLTSINNKTKKASFVNVVGDINPELIGKLAKNLNIPELAKMGKGMGVKKK